MHDGNLLPTSDRSRYSLRQAVALTGKSVTRNADDRHYWSSCVVTHGSQHEWKYAWKPDPGVLAQEVLYNTGSGRGASRNSGSTPSTVCLIPWQGPATRGGWALKSFMGRIWNVRNITFHARALTRCARIMLTAAGSVPSGRLHCVHSHPGPPPLGSWRQGDLCTASLVVFLRIPIRVSLPEKRKDQGFADWAAAILVLLERWAPSRANNTIC